MGSYAQETLITNLLHRKKLKNTSHYEKCNKGMETSGSPSETDALLYVNPGAMVFEIKLEKAIKRVIMPWVHGPITLKGAVFQSIISCFVR